MIDLLVDAAIKYADLYTVGMLAVPLALLGWTWKVGRNVRSEGASPLTSGPVLALVAATAVAAAAFVPPYVQARAECRALLDARRGPALVRVDGEIRMRPLGADPRMIRYWRQNCTELLHRPWA